MVDRIFSTMGDLKIGKYVIVDEHPSRVVTFSKAKTGKHGSAKVRIDAVSLFDNGKRSLAKSADADVEVPIVERKRAQVVSVSGDSAQLMDLESYETFEVTIPADMRSEAESGKEIQYMEVMGKRLLLRVT